MLSVYGNYNGQNVQMLQPLAVKKPQKVVITFLEEDQNEASLEAEFEALFQEE